ncbi:MAG: hypothetical protein IPK91_15060 [Saprospiraceae bacterium]|nr:hypothetical protein [Saprospiraceae bacterium]MBK8298565.1 hypothetical protein [Saprospiraceae bacterium]
MRFLTLFLLICTCFCSCYSFKGISIPAEVNTFKLEQVIDQTYQAPATYPLDFYETLLSKIRKDSRLTLNDREPDIKFICKITQFNVSSQAAQANASSAINRLNVTVEVEMINAKDAKLNWKTGFARYQDFDANANFSTIQQQLTKEINNLLVDDIFNKAFTNW